MEPEFMNHHGKGGISMDLQQSLLAASLTPDVEDQYDMVVDQAMMNQEQSRTGSVAVTAGEKQPNQYRDVWAAILFLAAQSVLAYLAFAWGVPALHYANNTDANGNKSEDDMSISFTGILLLLITSSCAALLISGLALSVLMRAAHQLIQASLWLTVVSEVLLVVYFISCGYWMGALGALLFLALAGCYAASVWRRVPFAAANLQTALTAVQTNLGLVVTAYGIMAVVALATLLWVLAWLGIYVRSADCNNSGECVSHMNPLVLFSLLLMYFWMSSVGKNILHVTTAGVVGTWWFAPDEASTFCSPAVTDSLVRASTFSLGSICLGSLLTAVLQVLHYLAQSARRQGRGNDLVLCILDCILSCLERLTTYFNKWSYVYIGLYGYDYLTAGKKVMNLFVERGWTAIINDNLVMRVLNLVCIVIGMVTGCVGLLLASAFPSWVSEFGSSATSVAFLIPALVGTAFSYILMGVVASAVDTVVVAFCEAPLEFERNHPGLSAQMVDAWRQIYPEVFGR